MKMRSFKYDGKIHYEQELELVTRNKNHVILRGEKGRVLTHHTRNKQFVFDKNTYEYFFTDRWYTAALVLNDKNEVVYMYCNVSMPAQIQKEQVDFIDLEVDVIMEKGQIKVVDWDEYHINKEKYTYPKEIDEKVYQTVQRIQSDIKEKNFPFDDDYQNYV